VTLCQKPGYQFGLKNANLGQFRILDAWISITVQIPVFVIQ
jgi:hypothetical protein